MQSCAEGNQEIQVSTEISGHGVLIRAMPFAGPNDAARWLDRLWQDNRGLVDISRGWVHPPLLNSNDHLFSLPRGHALQESGSDAQRVDSRIDLASQSQVHNEDVSQIFSHRSSGDMARLGFAYSGAEPLANAWRPNGRADHLHHLTRMNPSASLDCEVCNQCNPSCRHQTDLDPRCIDTMPDRRKRAARTSAENGIFATCSTAATVLLPCMHMC
jgi:hypothetical protein